MEAASHNPEFAQKLGIPQKVAREYAHADEADDQWKKRDVAKKAAEQGMSPEIYKALYGKF